MLQPTIARSPIARRREPQSGKPKMKADAVRANTTSVQEPFQSFREKGLIDVAQDANK
jgi:hypothetical protein